MAGEKLVESKETKRKVFIGETHNRAEIVEEERNPGSVEGVGAKDFVNRAGSLHCPIGWEQAGFAAIFFYKKDGLMGPQYMFVCQNDVTKVPEQAADVGWKQQRDALMKSYGRARPAEVTRN